MTICPLFNMSVAVLARTSSPTLAFLESTDFSSSASSASPFGSGERSGVAMGWAPWPDGGLVAGAAAPSCAAAVHAISKVASSNISSFLIAKILLSIPKSTESVCTEMQHGPALSPATIGAQPPASWLLAVELQGRHGRYCGQYTTPCGIRLKP